MNPALEDLARLYVLDRLDADTRAAFAARLSSDSSLATLVDQLEAALDLRRGLLALSSPVQPRHVMKESSADLATLYVLDQLKPSERAAFEARLLHDEPGLAELVRDLEAGLAHGINRLPPIEPPAGSLARIEARIDARPRPLAAPTGPVRWLAFARWGIAAVIAVSLATLAVQSLRPRPAAAPSLIVVVGLTTDRSTVLDLPLQASAQDEDARFLQLASLAENFWAKPGELPVKLDAVAGDSRGYALFDPASRQGFIVIEQLPVAAPHQRYHLWMTDPATGGIREAGTLPLAGMSRGLYSFMIEPGDSPGSGRPNFFITVEDDSPSPAPTQPRGKVVLGRQRI